MISTCRETFSRDKRGSINFLLGQGGVNKVSCRRRDSDFTL